MSCKHERRFAACPDCDARWDINGTLWCKADWSDPELLSRLDFAYHAGNAIEMSLCLKMAKAEIERLRAEVARLDDLANAAMRNETELGLKLDNDQLRAALRILQSKFEPSSVDKSIPQKNKPIFSGC